MEVWWKSGETNPLLPILCHHGNAPSVASCYVDLLFRWGTSLTSWQSLLQDVYGEMKAFLDSKEKMRRRREDGVSGLVWSGLV